MKQEIDAQGLTPEEIQQALYEAKQKKTSVTKEQVEIELNDLQAKQHELIFELSYPDHIKKECKYPQCELACYFGDKKELCPTYSGGLK